jgi:hypothetical protein
MKISDEYAEKLAGLVARFEEARAEVDGMDPYEAYPGIILRIKQAEKALDAVRRRDED